MAPARPFTEHQLRSLLPPQAHLTHAHEKPSCSIATSGLLPRVRERFCLPLHSSRRAECKVRNSTQSTDGKDLPATLLHAPGILEPPLLVSAARPITEFRLHFPSPSGGDPYPLFPVILSIMKSLSATPSVDPSPEPLRLAIPLIAEDPTAKPSDLARPLYNNNRRPHNWAD